MMGAVNDGVKWGGGGRSRRPSMGDFGSRGVLIFIIISLKKLEIKVVLFSKK